jgi:hypothetical protein
MAKRTVTISSGTQTTTINGGDLEFINQIGEKLQSSAKELIEQNYTLILRDLGKAKAEDDDDTGKLPVVLTLNLTSMGRKIFIDAAIEWKRTKKTGDSLDPIILDPDQKDLPLGV